MEIDTLKDIGVEAKTEPKVLFCNYYVLIVSRYKAGMRCTSLRGNE